jgi:hypothetical protein
MLFFLSVRWGLRTRFRSGKLDLQVGNQDFDSVDGPFDQAEAHVLNFESDANTLKADTHQKSESFEGGWRVCGGSAHGEETHFVSLKLSDKFQFFRPLVRHVVPVLTEDRKETECHM